MPETGQLDMIVKRMKGEMTVKTVFSLALVIASLGASVRAQAPTNPQDALAAMLAKQANASVSVMPLRAGAYWVSGGVSNTGFVIGAAGVVAIDPQKYASVAQRELAEIANITPKPVDIMIVTHADPDHVNGLPGWPAGMRIIAHENAAAEIAINLTDTDPFDQPPPPEVKGYTPTETLRFSKDLVLDGLRVRLIHVGPAHTDGDLVVYFPDLKIVYAGDLLTGELYPFIHVVRSGPLAKGPLGALNKHGSSLGWIQAMSTILDLDADTYVPGHGPMQSKVELRKRLEATVARRAQIQSLFQQGMTLEQIKAAVHEPAVTSGPFPSFTETTYLELTFGT